MKNKKIKIALVERDLTQRELAKKARIPESILSFAINGKFNLDSNQKQRVAGLLGKPVNYLFEN